MSEYKSIKEVADELELSVQAIYYKLNNMDSQFKREHSKKIKNKLVIDSFVINKLKEVESLETNSKQNAESMIYTNVESLESNFKVFRNIETIEELKQQIEELKSINNSKEIELTQLRTTEKFITEKLEDKEKQLEINLEQLQNKDNQIKELSNKNNELDTHLQELNNKLINIITGEQQIKIGTIIKDTNNRDLVDVKIANEQPEITDVQSSNESKEKQITDSEPKKNIIQRLFNL